MGKQDQDQLPMRQLRELSENHSKLTLDGIKTAFDQIRAAYPSLKEDFFKVLLLRLKAKRFSDSDLLYVTNHVIDTCKYPTPTIADFISYDTDREIPSEERKEDLSYAEQYEKFLNKEPKETEEEIMKRLHLDEIDMDDNIDDWAVFKNAPDF